VKFQQHFCIFEFHNVAAYCRWNWIICDVHIENFLTNRLVNKFWKSVYIS